MTCFDYFVSCVLCCEMWYCSVYLCKAGSVSVYVGSELCV